MTHTYLLIAALPSSPAPLLNIPEVTQEKIFNADCTTFFVLNSGVTKPNLTNFLQGVQKIIADYSAKIKIAIFQSVSKRQRDE